MKVFLDVGGHRGETLATVFSPKFHFDMVHCFEPMPAYADFIKKKFRHQIADGKLEVHNFGLADFSGTQKLYGVDTSRKNCFADGLGASLFADKKDIDNSHVLECEFVKASDFFRQHINADDYVFLKMNCEGGEVLILRDLIASKLIHTVNFAYIDFDIVKIPSQHHCRDEILAELKAVGFDNFATNKLLTQNIQGYSDSANRILCAAPDAHTFTRLDAWDVIREKIRTKYPHWVYRKLMRRRKKLYRKFGLVKNAHN